MFLLNEKAEAYWARDLHKISYIFIKWEKIVSIATQRNLSAFQRQGHFHQKNQDFPISDVVVTVLLDVQN